MRYLTYMFFLIILFGCKNEKTKIKSIPKINKVFFKINPYRELTDCSIIPINKYGVLINHRLKIFDRNLNTNLIEKLDSICVIGYSNKLKTKKIFIEHWKFKDEEESKLYFRKLRNLSDGLRFKPPNFWKWELYENGIIFYYSTDTNPNDIFFINLMKMYNSKLKKKNNNCCQQWLYVMRAKY